MKHAPPEPGIWLTIALAGGILMITMGIRLTVGLFVHPLMADKGLTIAEISMALAVGQLSWGLLQPLFGAWADHGRPFAALGAGIVLLAIGQLLTIRADSLFLLTLAQGILSPAGTAAGSFSILIGIAASRITPARRSVASGIINAGGSLGQFVFAPLIHLVMQLRGYYASLVMLACAALAALFPGWFLCRDSRMAGNAGAEPGGHGAQSNKSGLRAQLRCSFRDPSYLLLHAGFFTCGFHVAFLLTHLPGEVSACGHAAAVSAVSISLIGLCNIAGSIGAGILGNHVRMKFILAAVYAARAAMIFLFLMSARSETAFYVFSAATGLTWLATVPPTAGIVGKLFGRRYLATLFALTFLTHQVGGFLGAWLGGVAMETSGDLAWVWRLDIVLALFAALVNLPIRESPPKAALRT